MSKHPWWWLLGFHSCPSILDDDHCDFIYARASLIVSIGILSRSKHPWLCWLGFYQNPSILNDDYCDLICVQARLMLIIGIWSMSKHPYDDYSDFIHAKASWWWLLQFDPCLSILDYVDWDSIKVQASVMMIIAIWSVSMDPWCWLLGFDPSMSKHPWWCWLGFYQLPSILTDDYCDLIYVKVFLMMITAN